MTPPWLPAADLTGDIVPIGTKPERRPGPGADKEANELRERSTTLPKILPALVELGATWRYINSGYQFRFRDDTILCWWPRTGSLIWQGSLIGSLPPALSVEDAIQVYRDLSATPARSTDHVVPACSVCGGKNSTQECSLCQGTQDDLCPVCFSFAHWCHE